MDELDYLYGVLKQSIWLAFETRIQKYVNTPMNMFFMLLCSLRNGGTWHYIAAMFRKKHQRLRKE